MPHLIQPVTIRDYNSGLDEKFGYTCQSGHATKGVASDIDELNAPNGADVSASDCGPWQLAEVIAGPGLVGEISFGVTCADSVTIRITGNGFTPSYVAQVFLNGVFVTEIDSAGIEDYPVVLADDACGAVVTVRILSGDADTVTLEILSIP